ncbi:MAG: patatin-like phospholipase family protein, partial [Arenimonas sp.]
MCCVTVPMPKSSRRYPCASRPNPVCSWRCPITAFNPQMHQDDGKSIALVLGAGGARGLTHIGVIEELQARGYRIEAVVGCSMGALVG